MANSFQKFPHTVSAFRSNGLGTCREKQLWFRYCYVPFTGALKSVVSMPVVVTSERNVSRKSKSAYTQAFTLTNWLLKYGLHDRNSFTAMQTIHANAHSYMAYSITVLLQNQENRLEKYNSSNREP